MIKSMTAFTSAKVIKYPFKVNIEIRSYNSRYLDIYLKITDKYRNIEEIIRSLISKKIARGRIEVIVKIDYESEIFYEYKVDKLKAKSYFKALNTLDQLFNLGGVNLNTLLGIDGIIKLTETNQDQQEKVLTIVDECLNKALTRIICMKIKEGSNIAEDLETRLNYVENILKDIEIKSSCLPKLYIKKLQKRISSITDNLVEIDPDRILHEVAFLANKSDISEEIVRSNSHIKQFRNIMGEESPIGKKLNFLLQEFNREFNTMGSKASNYEISYMIVLVKSELEKIKEQIQNVE